jgi:long-chain acyl-CoA synthetase
MSDSRTVPPLPADYPSTGFFGVAVSDPSRAAVAESSGRTFTYGDLATAANRISRALRAQGIRAGDTIAIMCSNLVELIEVYAGGVQAGLYMVAINWHLTAAEIAYILENSGARAIFAEGRFAEAALAAATAAGIPEGGRFVIGSPTEGGRSLDDLMTGQSDAPLEERSAGQVTFYTSGTTGKPKGVRKSFGAVVPADITLGRGIGLPPGDPDPDRVQIVPGPLYHAAPLAAAVGALDVGGFLVLMRHFDAQEFLDLVEVHRVNTAMMVPTMFHRLLALPEEVRAGADVSSLAMVSHMGAPCPVDVKRRMIEWWGPIITEGYSSTEGAGTTITSEEWLKRPGSVGRASAGVSIAILDEQGNPCPTGEPGAVFLTPTLWEFEYLDDEVKTRANRRNGMFTVGDIGYLDEDGYLFLCDRQAEVIISGGVNIYPAETEAALLEHQAVADVAVVGVPSEEWGEEVRAVVEPAAGVVADDALAAELVEHCRARIAHYKCPKAVDFVDSIGRDPNGKIRKATIRERYWGGRTRRI